jgi:hypothetical protein
MKNDISKTNINGDGNIVAIGNFLPNKDCKSQIMNLIRDKARGTIMCNDEDFANKVLKPAFVIYRQFFNPSQQNEILSCYLDTNGVKEPIITDDNFKQLCKLVQEHIDTRQKNVKELIEKCLHFVSQNNKLSLDTVEFIKNLEDEDLNRIKTMFKYVIGNFILKSQHVIDALSEQDCFSKSTRKIKYTKVFHQEPSIGGLCYTKKDMSFIEIDDIVFPELLISRLKIGEELATEESLRNFLKDNHQGKAKLLDTIKDMEILYLNCTQGLKRVEFFTKEKSRKISNLEIEFFATLTDIGLELYQLLQNEIEEWTTEYLDSVVSQHQDIGLCYRILPSSPV